MATDDRDRAEEGPEGRTTAEWVTLGVSIVIVALMIGAAIYEHVARDEPAGVRVAVRLDLEGARERDGLTYIPWTVENTGRDPAEQVVIQFEIMLNGEPVQESTTDITFLPNGGRAEGELVTDLDLATHTISAHVATLQTP